MIPTIITKTLARLWYSLDRRHRLITLRNLEFALGQELSQEQREELAQEVFHHFVLLFFEALEMLLMPLSHLQKKVIVIGLENAEAPWKLGKGILAIGAHAGNWEYTSMVYGTLYSPMSLVAREHDHPLMNRIIRFLRERGGNRDDSQTRGAEGHLNSAEKKPDCGYGHRSEHHHQGWDFG